MAGCEGQDWADYQGTSPSTSGLAFVMVKATEGTGYVNPDHAAQVAHARSEGLVVGHYHFARPGSMSAQVSYFLQHAGAKAGDLLAFDWEDTGVSGADKDAWIKDAQKAAAAHRVILYCNKDFWLHRDTTSFAGDGLWIADPDSAKGKPAITAPWVMHQYSSASSLDRNYSPMTAAQLKAWAAGTTPTPEDDVALTDADIQKIAKAVAYYDTVPAIPAGDPNANDDAKTNTTWTVRYAQYAAVEAARRAAANAKEAATAASSTQLSDAQVSALGAQIAAAPALVDALAEAVADKLAARLQS